MNITVAKTAGFCFGVERAVKLAFNEGGKQGTYTFGPIIHNDDVVAELKTIGIAPTEDLENEAIKTLIIRSHGVALRVYEIAEEQNIAVVDATCPYVKKIHKLVADYDHKGYQIILVGDETHPEIQGINGWAKKKCKIVKDLINLKSLQLSSKEKYLVVSQTTYKKQVVDQVVSFLEQNNYIFKYINTICNATKERQEEAICIAKHVECMIVVGSHYSSNTQKLYELCKKYCEKTYCVSDVTSLTTQMFENVSEIGITAGASTPNKIIEGVISWIKQLNVY